MMCPTTILAFLAVSVAAQDSASGDRVLRRGGYGTAVATISVTAVAGLGAGIGIGYAIRYFTAPVYPKETDMALWGYGQYKMPKGCLANFYECKLESATCCACPTDTESPGAGDFAEKQFVTCVER